MPWRLIRGFRSRLNRLALMRGPLLRGVDGGFQPTTVPYTPGQLQHLAWIPIRPEPLTIRANQGHIPRELRG